MRLEWASTLEERFIERTTSPTIIVLSVVTLAWVSLACSAATRDAESSQETRSSIVPPVPPSPSPRTYTPGMRPIRLAPCGKKRSSGAEIRVTSTYRCYRVSGKTALDLYAAMGRSGPGGRDASTHWRVTWHYTYSGFGSCRINSLDVSIDIRFTFPRWTNPVGAPLDLVHDWNRFMLDVIRHEAGHVRLAEQAGNEILRSLPGFGAPCDGFVRAADAVADSIIDRLREKQRLYDERTDHGATQGASLI